jgi:hypothetical protein
MTTRLIGHAICSVVFVLSCIVPTHLLAQGRGDAASNPKIHEAAAKPTPRSADGHPDLNGSWTAPGAATPKSPAFDANGVIQVGIGAGGATPRLDRSLEDQLKPPVDPNPPPYKPELLAKVRAMALDEVHTDPAFRCRPLGVPRVGAPRQIVQTPKLTVLIYQVDAGIGDQPGSYRLVPTDGRMHRTDVDPSYFGDSVGHWEGDTLVVDVNHLNDETWLAGGDGGSGYFHSDALHVVERYTRKGDTLRWEATVEDPNVLSKPWVVSPQTEILADTMVYEQPICEERETPHLVNTY